MWNGPIFRTEAYGHRVLGYALVSSLDAAINDLVWLAPTPANNTYAFAVSAAFAEENGIYSVIDMADYVNDGGFVYLATGDEFAQRPDGIASFEETYGFDLTDDQLLIISNATPAQTEQALNAGGQQCQLRHGLFDRRRLDGLQFCCAGRPLWRAADIRARRRSSAGK